MYKLRGWAFVPLVASSTSSEGAPDVEELRLARVVVDAVVVVADVDVAVVHEGHALDLLVKQAAGRLEVRHEVLDERLLDRGRRVRGPGGGRELVVAAYSFKVSQFTARELREGVTRARHAGPTAKRGQQMPGQPSL